MPTFSQWKSGETQPSAPSGVPTFSKWKDTQPATPTTPAPWYSLGSLSDAATTVGQYIGNKIIDTTGGLLGASPSEIRNPQVLKDTAMGLPKAALNVATQAVTHPIQSLADVGLGTARGISDTVTNAIINLTPESALGTSRDNVKAAVSQTLDKYLNITPPSAIKAGYQQAGSGAPAILAGGIGADLAGGLGMTAGFLGAGQTQQPLNASISQRADQAMSDLVGLGLFVVGSKAFNLAKEHVTTGIEQADVATKLPVTSDTTTNQIPLNTPKAPTFSEWQAAGKP